jgi:predicted N-acetyltransferase YhbS
VLAVDPAFQRRGLGTLLTLHGVNRAHAEGLPVVLFASPQGAPLYATLGFETKEAPVLESTGLVVPFMINEPHGGA